MSEHLSARKFAELVGVSNVQISKLVKQGRIPTNDAGKIPKEEGLAAYANTQRAGYDNTREHNARVRAENAAKKTGADKPKKPTPPPAPPPLPPIDTDADDFDVPAMPSRSNASARANDIYNINRAKLMATKAQFEDIKLKKERGELVERSLVYAEGADVATRTKEILDAMPARLGPQCEGKTAAEIQGIIYDALQVAYGHINGLIKQGQSEQE